MKFKAVLFDLDGTLLDTSEGVLASVQHTISTLNYPQLSHEELLTFIGPPVRKKMQDIYHISDEEAAYAMNIFRTNYGDENLLKAVSYDGMSDLLNFLNDHGIKVGVATYKREDMAKRVLEHCCLAHFFSSICGSDTEGKLTKAQVVEKCLTELEITNPSEAIMIGDSDNDAIGASLIGLSFIGVTYGFGFKNDSDVSEYEHIGSASDVHELKQILSQYI